MATNSSGCTAPWRHSSSACVVGSSSSCLEQARKAGDGGSLPSPFLSLPLSLSVTLPSLYTILSRSLSSHSAPLTAAGSPPSPILSCLLSMQSMQQQEGPTPLLLRLHLWPHTCIHTQFIFSIDIAFCQRFHSHFLIFFFFHSHNTLSGNSPPAELQLIMFSGYLTLHSRILPESSVVLD